MKNNEAAGRDDSVPTETVGVEDKVTPQMSEERGKHRMAKIILTCVVRIVVGCVFIFSGFVKAIDPWGTLYKFQDYLAAMSLDIWHNLVVVGVFGLCFLEFTVGVFILLGCFRRSVSLLGGAIMMVMLPLSLWVAVSNPVADCGCFGDAYIISNWATFWKNIALSAGMVWLILYNRRVRCMITPALQWIAFVATGAFIGLISLYGYHYQPLIDFRPFTVGTSLAADESLIEDAPAFVFVYEKNGKRIEVTESDSLPDENDGWTFIDRYEVKSEKRGNGNLHGVPSSEGFRVWGKDGEDDLTDEAVSTHGKELIVMMPDLKSVSPATTWKLNSLWEWSVKNNVKMIGVVSGAPSEIEEWEDLSMASYELYTAEDTQIKEAVRGNPGIIYLIDGVIKWKSSLAAIEIDDFMTPDISRDALDFGHDNKEILRNLVGVYISVLGVLIVLSFLPTLGKNPKSAFLKIRLKSMSK